MCAPLPTPQSRRYKGLKAGELPTCESLKDTIARALPYWNDVIAPEIKAGKNVIIAAHGNSLRGIVKHLEGESGRRGGNKRFFFLKHFGFHRMFPNISCVCIVGFELCLLTVRL